MVTELGGPDDPGVDEPELPEEVEESDDEDLDMELEDSDDEDPDAEEPVG